MGDKSNSVYYTIKRMTHKALQEIPDGFWAISSICEEDAGGEIYPIFVEQIPFTNERLHIWERIKELDLGIGRLITSSKNDRCEVMFVTITITPILAGGLKNESKGYAKSYDEEGI